ncbi:MAG: hypothetical protein MZV64_03970 [Ignavibacteriales bacterium]|nr:hypothetical protein [Ignavibacteriales bacterium]
MITLNKLGTNYRLCKGIYVESETIAYKNKQAIRDKFLDALWMNAEKWKLCWNCHAR